MAFVGAFLAFLITLLFMFTLRPIAEAIGLMDIRKGHKRNGEPVPVVGGLAMCLGLLFVSGFVEHTEVWRPVMFAMTLLVVVGTIDDRFELPASVRLIAQTCAALLVVVGAHITVSDLGRSFFVDLQLGPFSIAFSLLFIVTIINAFNVVDGIDGLAGGLSFIALFALAALGYGADAFHFVALLVGVVGGYLLFNFPLGFNRSVRSFMGDAGSTFLGMAIAAVGIVMTQQAPVAFKPVTGLWLISVPAFDLFSAVIRRMVQRKSPFAPDHEHLHHALIEGGLSRVTTLAFILTVAASLAFIGVLGHLANIAEGVMLIGWFAALIGYYQTMRRAHRVAKLIEMLRPANRHRAM